MCVWFEESNSKLFSRDDRGEQFRCSGAATWKLCWPNSVLVSDTNMSPLCTDEQRSDRPVISTTRVQTSLKETGLVPRTQLKAADTTFEWIRWVTGCQWRTLWRTVVMWLNLPAQKITLGRLVTTRESWGVNGDMMQCTSSISVVLQLWVVSGWGLMKKAHTSVTLWAYETLVGLS